jgi:hypothetical protein
MRSVARSAAERRDQQTLKHGSGLMIVVPMPLAAEAYSPAQRKAWHEMASHSVMQQTKHTAQMCPASAAPPDGTDPGLAPAPFRSKAQSAQRSAQHSAPSAPAQLLAQQARQHRDDAVH